MTASKVPCISSLRQKRASRVIFPNCRYEVATPGASTGVVTGVRERSRRLAYDAGGSPPRREAAPRFCRSLKARFAPTTFYLNEPMSVLKSWG